MDMDGAMAMLKMTMVAFFSLFLFRVEFLARKYDIPSRVIARSLHYIKSNLPCVHLKRFVYCGGAVILSKNLVFSLVALSITTLLMDIGSLTC